MDPIASTPATRTCATCAETKPRAQFKHTTYTRKSGAVSVYWEADCRVCSRVKRKRKYRIDRYGREELPRDLEEAWTASLDEARRESQRPVVGEAAPVRHLVASGIVQEGYEDRLTDEQRRLLPLL